MQKAFETLVKATSEFLCLPENLKVWEWAEKRRRMGKEVTALAGRYSTENTPYQKKPQEDLTAGDVQITVMCWASRLGKTECENNLIGYVVECNPCNILFVWPTIDRAKIWSKQILAPMLRSTPELKRRFKESRAKDADNTILSKRFPGGNLTAIGSNSPSGFRGIQAPIVICDEVDAMEGTPEGDPIALSFKRAENHAEPIQVVSSTPTIKGASRIWSWLERSDFQKWHCPCPRCGKHQVLMWEQIKWEAADGSDAWIECAHCFAKLSDAERFSMVMAGEWRATRPFTGIRGFWLNGINSTFPTKKGYKTKLHQFVSEYLSAKEDGEEALITWTNTFKSEPYEVVSQSADSEELIKRCKDYGCDIPDEVLMLTCGGDVQPDRIEAEIVGWGEEEQSWGIEYRVFAGNTEDREVWEEFDLWLEEKRFTKSGRKIRIAQTFVDSGFDSKTVYQFTRKREFRKVWAVKGDRFGPVCASRPSRRNEANAGLYHIGTNAAKSALFHRLKIITPGPRMMHWPIGNGYTEEWFDGFTAEHLIAERVQGKMIYVWKKKDENGRNEPLDCRVYAFAAMASLRPNWKAIKSNFSKTEPAEKPVEQPTQPRHDSITIEKAEQPKPEVRMPSRRLLPRRGSSFVNGW